MKPLSPKQQAIARLLASGESGAAACKATKTHPATLCRWRKHPLFQAHLRELLQQLEKESLQNLYALKTRAVDRLGELLQSSSEQVALRAVEAVLDRTATLFDAGNYDQQPSANAAWHEMQRELERLKVSSHDPISASQ